MPRKTNDPAPKHRYLNRELSSLAFNRRVLELAKTKTLPLLERVRFLSIAASNLDEFYMVRVAALKNQTYDTPDKKGIDGRLAVEQLPLIVEETHALMDDMQACWRGLERELAKHKIELLHPESLSKRERQWLHKKFELDIFPVLTPLAIDPAHPFPFIPSREMAIYMHLQHPKTGEEMDALLPLPTGLDRFIRLPDKKNGVVRYVRLQRAILDNLKNLFAPYVLKDYATFRVLRDSEIDFGDDAEDLLQNFESALKQRRRGDVIQLLANKKFISPKALAFLKKHLDVEDDGIFLIDGVVGLGAVAEFVAGHTDKNLYFEPYQPRKPERVLDAGGDIFAAIASKDMIIHHPYESFDVVVNFLQQAAKDPDVVAIKQTLYRTSKDSPIIKALVQAAEAGKSVTVMVELKARFDEEANMKWARDLERAGAKVVFGYVDLKTHAKMSLVVRNEGKRKTSYAHFGTGNYHPDTAKFYTDLSFFTCDPDLCGDMARLFNYMTSYTLPEGMKKLYFAPLTLRSGLYDLIQGEIVNAKAGKPSGIWMKMNSLVDAGMIDRLYEASQAGVPVQLVVRGLCALKPGVKGLSETIQIKSIVGRYLEHARIYCFGNGAALPSAYAKVFISSADLMTRNLDHRIETLVPVENKTARAQVLDQIMVANLKDVKSSWLMQSDGKYIPFKKTGGFSAHDYFMQNPSLSGRGSAVLKGKMPPELNLE